MYDCCNPCCPNPGTVQRHVHEYVGSVKIAELVGDPHNHRFDGITEEGIPAGNSHVHKIRNKTDFYEDHYHLMCDTTGIAVPVGGGKHVHFDSGNTDVKEGHSHEFVFATEIEDPTGD